MKTSILIPVYNRSKIISETIESALNQTYKDIEVIIVDNCSDDNTYDICKSYENKDSRVTVYRNQENLGPVRNWLECLAKSNGEYVKFLWSDDWIENDFIEKTIPYLSDSNIAFAYSPAYIVYEDEKKLAYNIHEEDRVLDSSEFEDMALFWGNAPVSPGCAVFRKKDVLKNLLVDIPNDDNLSFNIFGAGNDLLLFLLPLMNYSKVAYVSSTRSYFRSHKGSLTISNNLNLYYDWAKLYYLQLKNQEKLLRKNKSLLLTKRIRDKTYRNIYNKNQSNISISFLLAKVFNRYFGIKIKNR